MRGILIKGHNSADSVDNLIIYNNQKVVIFVNMSMAWTYSMCIFHLLDNVVIIRLSINLHMSVTITWQENADMEWKFSRSQLWISYFVKRGFMPHPLNIIPSPLDIYVAIRYIISACRYGCQHAKRMKFVSMINIFWNLSIISLSSRMRCCLMSLLLWTISSYYRPWQISSILLIKPH